MDKNNMVYVTNASDHTIVVDIPELSLKRTWNKRGQKYPFDRQQLEQAYYDPAVEYLFKQGMITTDDKEFLKNVGLMDEEENSSVVQLTDQLLNRMIKFMPMVELKDTIATLSHTQLKDLGEYAIAHYADLQLDRIDLLSQATGKNLLKAIENYKASQEA